MSDSSAQTDPVLLADFLDYLKVRGFDIGVDDYLRVQQLLLQPDLFRASVELKLLLCPLFATSEKQQKQFYDSFKAFFDHVSDEGNFREAVDPQANTNLSPEPSPLPAQKSNRRNFVVAPTVMVIAVILAGGIWLVHPRHKTQPQLAAIILPTVPPSPTPTPTPPETYTIRHVIGQPYDPAWKDRIVGSPQPILLPDKKVIVNERLRRNWKWLALAAGAIPLLVAGLVTAWRRSKRRQLQSRQKSDKRPPFTWPLTVPITTQRLHEVSAFNAVTRALRRRQQGESLRLDVVGTISETIARSGFPTLKFRPVSKVPEYLILIDRATLADHQARFFDDFVTRLKEEDVFVESYFYDSDPRVCYRSDYRTGVLLEDLPRHGHRLLVYGNGTRLLEPDSGELAEWVEWFADWDDRALLTPVAPKQWGLRERKLSELFLVLPATIEGLREAISHFEMRNQQDLRAWRQRSNERELPVFDYDSSAEKTADKLKTYLGDDNLFQWVCACAAYPTLQWDLTLCLGQEVMPGRELWEKDILRLARLPWFQQGVMPEELRHCLLRRLTPKNQRNISAKLIELLQQTEKELPEKFNNSWARESLNLQIEIQQWLAADRTAKQAAALRRKFRELPPSLTVRDYATLREVDAEPLSPPARALVKRLPEDWRARLFPHGLPPLGPKPVTQLALASPLALLLMISIALFKPVAQTITSTPPPLEENVTILARPTPERSPSPTPTASPTPPGNGEIQLAFDRSLPASISLLITIAEAGNRLRGESFVHDGGGSALTLTLPAGSYRSIAITEVRRIGELQASGIQCSGNIQVSTGKLTVVPCRVPSRYQVASVACFSPNAEITLAEREVPPDTSVTLYANVQGGQNYGNLSFSWTPSAGRISSGVSRSGQPIDSLDTTGVAPGTTINLTLRVNSSAGNCAATAQASVRIRPLSTPTPPPTPTPVVMPTLSDQDISSARRTLDSLGVKLQVDEQFVTDLRSKPDFVIRQDPIGGTVLSAGQKVTLYVAKAPVRVCYGVQIERIQVDDNGSTGAARWSFDVSAESPNGATKVITVPERNYYRGRNSDQQPGKGASSSNPRQSSTSNDVASGTWCETEGARVNFTVTGYREGEKNPDKATARGVAPAGEIEAPAKPFSLSVRATTKARGEGDFTFYLTFNPTRPSTR